MQRFGCPILIVAVVLGGCLSSARAGYRLIHEPSPDDPAQTRIYQLDNGLTVYLTQNHETPRFYAEFVVRAGHKQDPPETTGLAHYLEHLLFKGSQKLGTLDYEKERSHIDRTYELYEQRFSETDEDKRKAIYAEINEQTQLTTDYIVPNELSAIYRAMGATGLNAHTWFEETVYRVSLPSNRLEQWAVIESDRFADPVFRLFPQELEIVYEEKNRAMDNKDRIMFEVMARELFKSHPYGQQTTLGEVEHLKNPSLETVRRYFETYYVPNNMAIAMSGDIEPDAVMALIDEHFSSWRRAPLPEPKTWTEPPLEEPVRLTVEFDAEPALLVGFRIPGRNHEDAEALRVIDMILSNRTAGLVDLNLVQSQKVRRAGSSIFQMNDYGWMYFYAVPKADQSLEQVEALLLEQLELVKQGEFDESLVRGIITSLKKRRSRGLESNHARVAMMRNAFLAGQDWDHVVAEIDRIEKLTKADIVEAANRYYGGGYVATHRVPGQHEVPGIEKPAIDPIQIDSSRRSPFAKQVIAAEVEPIEPTYIDPDKDFAVLDYADGVQLMHAPNHINDLFTLSFVIETGRRHDPALPVAAELMNKAGAGAYSPAELQKKWFEIGTDPGIGAGRDRTTITITGLDENFEESVALLMQWLNQPTSDDATLKQLVANLKTQRREAKKNHGTMSAAIRQKARFGDRSSFITAIDDEQIDALTADELLAKINGLLGHRHEIRYTGSLPISQVESVLRAHHPIRDALRDPPPYEFIRARRPEGNEIRFFHKELAQAHVSFDFADVPYDESLIPVIELFNQYFSGGMDGLVMQELRESQALVYSAGASYRPGGRTGEENRMAAGLGCQADKTVEAIASLIALLDDLPQTPQRFEQAQASILNRYRTSKIGFRGVLGAVDGWRLRGLDADPRPVRFDKIGQAELAELLAFHQGHVAGRPKLITIVGDRSRIDLEALGRYGNVIEVSQDELFSY